MPHNARHTPLGLRTSPFGLLSGGALWEPLRSLRTRELWHRRQSRRAYTISHRPQVACTQDLRRDLVIVTAGTSAMATFLVGVGANLPFALAPGMGLNAYFTCHASRSHPSPLPSPLTPHPSPLTPSPAALTRYTVVGFRGSGPHSFETALGAVFIEGIIFMAIAALGLRGYIVQAIPAPLP